MTKPTHYLVVRSPFAEALVLGIKTFEWRSWAEHLANKTVAIAVAKAKCPAGAALEESLFWKATPVQTVALQKLVDTPANGFIIGQVTFGEAAEYPAPANGYGVYVQSAKLWKRQAWLHSPGGLGLRPLP